MRATILVSIWTITFGVVSVFFTNCQQHAFQANWPGSTTKQGSSEIPEPYNPETPDAEEPNVPELDPNGFLLFEAGDQLLEEHIPTRDTYVHSHFAAYMTDDGYKAIALSATGEGFLSYSSNGSAHPSKSQSEANRRALEGCFIKADGDPCAIFSEGETIKYNVDGLLAAMAPSTLPALNETYANTKVPWVTDALRGGILSKYKSFSNSKALALSLSGAGCYRQGHSSQAEAARRALQCCEWASKGEACVVFAADDKVVFDIKEHNYPTALPIPLAPATFDPNKVPFVSKVTHTALAAEYGKYVAATGTPVALAVSDVGDWAYRTGATEAQARAQAKAACVAAGTSTTCLIYAIDNEVVLTLQDLKSL